VIDWSLILVIAEWSLRLAMLPIIVSRQRGSSDATLAWLVVVFFMPWIGSVLYFLVGEIRLGKRRLTRYARHADAFYFEKPAAATARALVRPEVIGDARSVPTVAEHLGAMPIVGGNAVEIVMDSARLIDELVAAIDGARSHAHVLTYILRPDATGTRVCDALARAAARGVECRLLVDAAGSSDFLRRPADDLRARGVRVIANFPVGLLRARFHRVDLRNHRKLAVIDGRTAFTGSQNLIDANYGHKRIGAWQDLSLVVRGPAVAYVQAVFAEDWHYETGEDLDTPAYFPDPLADASALGDVPIQVVPSGPHTREGSLVRDLFLEALHTSRRRVVVTTPYFVPDEAMMTALRLAALRGVTVDIVTPARTDARLADLCAHGRFQALLDAGVGIHLHRVGLLHAKTMSVDDSMAFIGSANLDMRSFFLNFELSLVLYGSDAAARLRACQARYLAESTRLLPEAWAARPRSQRALEDVATLFSPLM
jgi:cardiolipin synthase